MNRLRLWNTLRNQIFVGFLVVMIVVLGFAGNVTYDRVSELLQRSAEKRIQQTAVQANDTLEALLKQIDTLSMQIATEPYVQQLLRHDVSGAGVTFGQRQSLLGIMDSYQVHVSGVRSLELYTNDGRRLFPLADVPLKERIPEAWVQEADRASGPLVWAGIDPSDAETVLAIRRVRLMEQQFEEGGYLLIRLNREYFASGLAGNRSAEQGDAMLLFDASRRPISSTFEDVDAGHAADLLDLEGSTATVGATAYIAVRQASATTGWTYVLLTPVAAATEGIDVLRTALVFSGVIGALLFLVMSFLLSTMITRPMLGVIRAMKGARLGSIKPNPRTYATMEINELNHSYNQMVDNINHLIRVVYEKQLLQSRTELAALQAQINPHFLFNTLEAFYWSLDEKGEDELARHVLDMSGLFRYTISGDEGTAWVEMKKELEHAERYLQLMKLRLGDRLEWTIAADPAFACAIVPKLLIQPLVENAILHGVEGRIGPGAVAIRVQPSSRPGWMRVEVEDNGPGMDELTLDELERSLAVGGAAASKRGAGVGLLNVQRRLLLYFADVDGGAAGLSIESRPSEGAKVSFEIPITGWGNEA